MSDDDDYWVLVMHECCKGRDAEIERLRAVLKEIGELGDVDADTAPSIARRVLEQ